MDSEFRVRFVDHSKSAHQAPRFGLVDLTSEGQFLEG